MKILIVDDNGYNRKIFRSTLEQHGCFDIIEARDGEEGLEKAGNDLPGLILSDTLMPRMDGLQLLKVVKSLESLKSIPFILYSAASMGDKAINLAMTLGAIAFIANPAEPEELWKIISGIMA